MTCKLCSYQVFQAAVDIQQKTVEKERARKSSSSYKEKRKAARYSATSTTAQHQYGPHCQQPDPPKEELMTLCQEYFEREVVVTQDKAADIEVNTRGQAECNLWYHHRRLRLTASNFGKVAKRREKTPVANLVKSLLYSRASNTKELRWGRAYEVDAQNAYQQYLKGKRDCQDAELTNTGLVIDVENPCLACSPDALVKIPGTQEPHGIAEYKCPYSLAHADSGSPQTALEAARVNKRFYCKLDISGNIELKENHEYYFQVQGNMAITKRKWCDFVVWTPQGISVQRIAADQTFWEKHKATLLRFYKEAILPELTLPRFSTGQAIREPFLAADSSADSEIEAIPNNDLRLS